MASFFVSFSCHGYYWEKVAGGGVGWGREMGKEGGGRSCIQHQDLRRISHCAMNAEMLLASVAEFSDKVCLKDCSDCFIKPNRGQLVCRLFCVWITPSLTHYIPEQHGQPLQPNTSSLADKH